VTEPIVEDIATVFETPCEVVFRFRLDATNLPSVNSEVSNVRRVEGEGEPGPGTRYLCNIAFAAGTLLSSIDVVEVEPMSRIVVAMESWPIDPSAPPPEPVPGTGMRADEVLTFTPTESGGTHLLIRLTIWPPDAADETVRALLRDGSVATIRTEMEGMRARLRGGSR
jgi:hypothetical protein